MLAHQALLPLVLLLTAATSVSAHLPSHLDRSRIRSVAHRRHHARRAAIPCDASVKPNDSHAARSLDDEGVLPGFTRSITASPFLLAGRQETGAVDAVVEVVKDAVEDVITPALAKALQLSATADQSVAGSAEDGANLLFSGDSVDPIPGPLTSSTGAAGSSATSASVNANVYVAAPAAAVVCDHGEWKCDGMTLKRCNWNEWNAVNVCSGTNIVCSDRDPTIGCVWTWSVDPNVKPISPPTVAAPRPAPASASSSMSTSLVQTAATPPTISVAAPPSSSVPTTQPASSSSSPVVSAAKPSSSTIVNDDGEECEEWEEEVWVEEDASSASSKASTSSTNKPSVSSSASTTSAVAATTVAPSSASVSSATPSPSAAAGDDDDCEEWEDEAGSSYSTSSTGATSKASTASSTTTSQLGHVLAASPSQTVSPSTTTTTHSSSTTTVSTTSSLASASTTSEGLITQNAIAATISASSDVLSNLTNPSKTLSVIDVNTISISSITTTSSATQGVVTGSPTGVASYSAPHYVIYSDYWLFSMPDVSTLTAFNRFILAFWMSDQGPVDNAQMWVWMSQDDRRKVLDSYHKAGIALMVSAFGSTDQPTTWGKDPIATAQGLAKFVIAYEFDGVDIDYEDMGAMNSDKAEAWLIPFQRELRRLLPKPYLISHAPVAPWFTSSNVYRSGAYVAIHQQVGDGIDFYNMQFYNQGDGVYMDCQSLINQSGGYWPGTSVMEMNAYAKVPLEKIVIGKPLDSGKADNGYMSPESLNTCVKMARNQGWNGGVMYWEWTTDAPRIMAASRAQ